MASKEKRAKTDEQIAKLEALQDMILDNLKEIIQNNTATATDRATIIRLLKDNGWDLDPSRLNIGDLNSKLTSNKRFDDLDEDETGEPRLRAI